LTPACLTSFPTRRSSDLKLGILDPKTGKFEEIGLGARSAPHGVVVGPDGAPWITDGGQNAIVRVDPKTRAVKVWPLPADASSAKDRKSTRLNSSHRTISY